MPRDPASRITVAFTLCLAACSLDSTNPSGSGSGGGGAAASSTGATQATTGASTSDAASSSGMGGAASSTGNAGSTASSSSDASSSAMASSSSGGPTDVPFCSTSMGGQTDDFDGYGSDVGFFTIGLGSGLGGVWEEFASGIQDVQWENGQIRTNSPPAFLGRRAAVSLPTDALPACAITVKLSAVSGGNAAFGVIADPAPGPAPDPNQTAIILDEAGGDVDVTAFGFAGPTNVPLPLTLAIVVRPGHILGFYLNGGTWTPLHAMAQGVAVSWLSTSTATIRFGHRDGGGESRWDDYDVVKLPASVLQ